MSKQALQQPLAINVMNQNMVDSQIKTNGVHEEKLLDAFLSVPRCAFIPDAARAAQAYVDADFPLYVQDKARFLMEPRVFAKLIQAANIQSTDKILCLGCGTGYSAAVLTYLSNCIFAVESRNADLDFAKTIWEKYGYHDIQAVNVDTIAAGYIKNAPYQVIIIEGTVPFVPAAILAQLAIGGRLVTVLDNKQYPHQAVIIERFDQDHYDTKPLCDAFILPCPEFQVTESQFSF